MHLPFFTYPFALSLAFFSYLNTATAQDRTTEAGEANITGLYHCLFCVTSSRGRWKWIPVTGGVVLSTEKD
jgi:hypothetical protein